MIVQEAGVAVGWPLGLGHDTTGWPLGLRLRLAQEDLQWPREPGLTRSPSFTSEDSSSLDTMSTRSFFQDKSISLGTLMGLPPGTNHPANRHDYDEPQQKDDQHDNLAAFRSPTTAMIASTSESASPVRRQPRKANNIESPTSRDGNNRNHDDHHVRSSTKKKKQHPPSPASSFPSTPRAGATSAGWSFLSVLNCARVPIAGIGRINEDSLISIPRAEPVVREIEAQSSFNKIQDLGVALQESDDVTASATIGVRLPIAKISLQEQLNSPGRKLYDNITFEDDDDNLETNKMKKTKSSSASSDGSPSSKELNPLFTCSPLGAQEEIGEDNGEADDKCERLSMTMTEAMAVDHHLESLREGSQRASSYNTIAGVLTSPGKFCIESNALQHSSLNSRLRIGSLTSTLRDTLDAARKQHVKDESVQYHTSKNYDSLVVSRSIQSLSRNKAVSLFISRMVCCLSTPTRGSTQV